MSKKQTKEAEEHGVTLDELVAWVEKMHAKLPKALLEKLRQEQAGLCDQSEGPRSHSAFHCTTCKGNGLCDSTIRQYRETEEDGTIVNITAYQKSIGQYRCESCGGSGLVSKAVYDRLLATQDSSQYVPCPTCPHWMHLHTDKGCGSGACPCNHS